MRSSGLFLWRLPRLALYGLVRFYQLAIGPWLPSACRFSPSCSEYSLIALREYGAVRGFILSVWRILRCNPWGGHGYDPPRWFGEEPSTGCGHDHDHDEGPPSAVISQH